MQIVAPVIHTSTARDVIERRAQDTTHQPHRTSCHRCSLMVPQTVVWASLSGPHSEQAHLDQGGIPAWAHTTPSRLTAMPAQSLCRLLVYTLSLEPTIRVAECPGGRVSRRRTQLNCRAAGRTVRDGCTPRWVQGVVGCHSPYDRGELAARLSSEVVQHVRCPKPAIQVAPRSSTIAMAHSAVPQPLACKQCEGRHNGL